MSEDELVDVLLKMDRLRSVDFRPLTRIRKLTSRNFSWRKDGPVQYFIKRVVPEFFNTRFDAPGDEFRFMGGVRRKVEKKNREPARFAIPSLVVNLISCRDCCGRSR